MPAKVSVDMTPLFPREVEIRGTYANGTERIDASLAASLGVTPSEVSSELVSVRTFALAIALMDRLHLGWMVTHHVSLDDVESAIERASDGGRVDALTVVFDLRSPRQSSEERTS
jgi:threonine dehydrogenase-like Zn-dependent dehydrogenase